MSNRSPYSYVVLRYIHDIVSGEFVNIGVLFFSPDKKFVKFKCKSSLGRVASMFPTADGSAFKAVIDLVKARYSLIAAEVSANLNLWEQRQSLARLAEQIVPKDDSSLVWSHVSSGATADLEQSFEKIYARYVQKFEKKKPALRHRSDADIWRSFRKNLERRNILNFFEKKSISGKDDEMEFPFAWKNGVWHCIEPISFDLTAPESIREKAHKWLGQITSITDSSEKFRLYFVLAKPKSANLSAAFEKAVSILEKAPVDHEVYIENQMDTLVSKLSAQLEQHEQECR